MIEPVCQGAALLAEIGATKPVPGSLIVWWLGQSGFLIKSQAGQLLIDPYLSEHLTRKYEATDRPHIRMTRAPLRGGDLRNVDLVICSHKHSDHLDPGTVPDLLATSTQAIVAVPAAIRDHAIAMGLPAERVVGLQPTTHASLDHAGFHIRAIPSAHEGLDTDEFGRHLYLGYVIESEGLRLYHSGDSLAYEGLPGELGNDSFDVLFLPINGRNPARKVPGNMSAAEAVDLASLIKPRFVVPHHYNMFTFNTVPIEEFSSEAHRLPNGVAPWILRCGERWEIGR